MSYVYLFKCRLLCSFFLVICFLSLSLLRSDSVSRVPGKSSSLAENLVQLSQRFSAECSGLSSSNSGKQFPKLKLNCAFSALTLLVGRQEGHPACKNWVVRYWHGYLSEARCKWFAYGPAGIWHPVISCSSKIRMVYLPGAGLPRLSWKKCH